MTPPPPAAESPAQRALANEQALPGGPLAAAGRFLERSDTATAAVCLALVASVGFLLGRIVGDVRGKPLYDDEVVAGLTALHPLGEVLDIVLLDRGGAPLHFVLAHLALSLDASPDALRWLSVVFAIATIPVCYDLGRRLGGRAAGVVTAVVVATSSMLAVYGTIGRMYALLAFVSALAADLFVRALERRTPGAVLAAAAAAWLLPATHPYGIVLVAIEALVALAIWRGRPLRPALPVLALALALTPFIVADLRLSERFGVAAFERERVAPPDFAAKQLGEALAAFAGGAGALALVFFGLALAGLFVVGRRMPAFGAFAFLALAAIPVLMVLAKAEQELVHRMSPRHLMFALPLWAALVGVGATRIVRDLPRPVGLTALAAAVVAAVLAPPGMTDPRVEGNGSRAALAGPAAWVQRQADDEAVLFFYSPLFLATLPDTAEAMVIPRSGRPLRMAERADYPASSIVVALPLAGTQVDPGRLAAGLGEGAQIGIFDEWVVLESPGPFADPHAVLTAGREALVALWRATPQRSYPFGLDMRAGALTVCAALAELGDPCPERVFARTRAAGP